MNDQIHRHLPTAVVAKQLTNYNSVARLSVWLDSQRIANTMHVDEVKLSFFPTPGSVGVTVYPGDWVVQDPALPEDFRFYVLDAETFNRAFYETDSGDLLDQLLSTADEIDGEVGGNLAQSEYRDDSIIQSVRNALASIAARLRNIHYRRNP